MACFSPGIQRLFGKNKENHGSHSGKEDSEVQALVNIHVNIYFVYQNHMTVAT